MNTAVPILAPLTVQTCVFIGPAAEGATAESPFFKRLSAICDDWLKYVNNATIVNRTLTAKHFIVVVIAINSVSDMDMVTQRMARTLIDGFDLDKIFRNLNSVEDYVYPTGDYEATFDLAGKKRLN